MDKSKANIFTLALIVLNIILISVVIYFIRGWAPKQQVTVNEPLVDIQNVYAQIIQSIADDAQNVIGDENAPVTIVEFSDFQCPFCKKFHDEVFPQIEDNYISTGKVRLVYVHLPFLGDESRLAAEASECASEQGAFWAYHDMLFEKQNGENLGAFSRERLKKIASDLDLDSKKFDSCLDSGKYSEFISSQIDIANQLGIQSTPWFIISNGRNVIGAQPYSVFRNEIDAALEQ